MSALQNLAKVLSWPAAALGHLRYRRGSPEARFRDAVVARMAAPGAAGLPVERDDPDDIARGVVARHIARLMLADEWMAIADQIADWEAELAATPGGQRFHDIGVQIALSGLETLIDEAPRDTLADLEPAEAELGHFLDTHRRSPGDHVLALLAARAHLMVGLACRADHWPGPFRREAWRRMAGHFVAAGEILDEFDALAAMSPLLAEARYLQAQGTPGGGQRLPELFDEWIALDPSNPAIYARHADWLADADLVADAAILSEADRALERTEETLGFGGYALFFLPLLDMRPGARDLVDAELLAAAILDLATGPADQAEVNWAAGTLAGEIGAAGARAAPALRETLYLLIRTRMRVVHPRLWPIPEDAVLALVAAAEAALPDIPAEPEAGAPLRHAA